MKDKHLLLLSLLICTTLFGQTTAIPDPGFEEWLIDHNIDSDGSINGQVLTSDITAVTELNISGWDGFTVYNISDLTGLQDFTSLEHLAVSFTNITALNVSQNLQLKELICGSNEISELDLSTNTLLEIINIGTGGDVGPFNTIHILDLSSNPAIHTVRASDCYSLDVINLRNGANNPNMTIDIGLYPDWSPEDPHNDVCIQIDDEAAAQAEQLPYSEWTIAHSFVTYQLLETCELGLTEFKLSGLIVYPNPAKDLITIHSDFSMSQIFIYDAIGRNVLSEIYNDTSEASLNIAGLQSGNYIINIVTSKGNINQNLIVK